MFGSFQRVARDGEILTRNMVLKADDLLPLTAAVTPAFRISGAPNFRQVPQWPLIGVGQPTVYGSGFQL